MLKLQRVFGQLCLLASVVLVFAIYWRDTVGISPLEEFLLDMNMSRGMVMFLTHAAAALLFGTWVAADMPFPRVLLRTGDKIEAKMTLFRVVLLVGLVGLAMLGYMSSPEIPTSVIAGYAIGLIAILAIVWYIHSQENH